MATSDLDGDDAGDPLILDDQIDTEVFVETLDRRILDRGLEERVQHVKAGLVGGKPGPFDLHSAEGADIDVPVFRPAPRTAPMLELGRLFGTAGDEVFDHVLFAQPVATMHGVVEVVVEAVAGLLDPG